MTMSSDFDCLRSLHTWWHAPFHLGSVLTEQSGAVSPHQSSK